MIASSWSIVRHALPAATGPRRGRAVRRSGGDRPLLGHQRRRYCISVIGPVRARARERRQLRGDERQVERRRPADLGGQLDDARIAGEAAVLLGARAQVGAGGGRQPRVELVQAAPGAHRGDRGGQAPLGGGGVVDVVGGHALDMLTVGEFGKGVVAGRVERIAVVPQLDEHPVAPERLDEALQLAAGGRGTVGDEGGRYRTLAAAGEHPTVTGDGVGDVGERELWCPLLAGEVPVAQHAGESAVAAGTVGEHQQVRAVDGSGAWESGTAGVDLGSVSARSGNRAGRRRGPASVISVPNTVGRPTALAASAKRTTP